MRIQKEIYNHIVFELNQYENNKDELQMERERILEESSVLSNGQPTSKTIGDPTANKVVNLTESTIIIALEKSIRAIESVLRRLSDTHNRLFQEVYVKKRTSNYVLWAELGVSQETFNRYKKSIIYGVGYELGWIKINVT